MIKIELLKKILNADDDEIKKLDVEQLRVLLGVFRYFVRRLEREVNQKTSDEPLGSFVE